MTAKHHDKESAITRAVPIGIGIVAISEISLQLTRGIYQYGKPGVPGKRRDRERPAVGWVSPQHFYRLLCTLHIYAYISVSAGESQAVNEKSNSLRRDAIFNSVLPLVDELSSWNMPGCMPSWHVHAMHGPPALTALDKLAIT